jgi:hypothetical protein
VTGVLAAALVLLVVLCGSAAYLVYRRNRELRLRPGEIPGRLRHPTKGKWISGHGVWAHDVFALRGAPAAWTEALFWVVDATVRSATDEERKQLQRIGDDPVVSRLELASGGWVELAARRTHAEALLGPFAEASDLLVVLEPAIR